MQSKKASSRHPNEKRSRSRAARIFSILVALTAATAALPGTPVDATPTSHNPTGTLGVRASGDRIHLYGAASDPDAGAHSIRVVYYLNGTPRETDIAGPKHHYDRSGWSATHLPGHGRRAQRRNRHRHGARNQDRQAGESATRNPRGNAHFARTGRALHLHGTAYDPDKFRSGAIVRVYDNGHKIGAARSNSRTHRYGSWRHCTMASTGSRWSPTTRARAQRTP